MRDWGIYEATEYGGAKMKDKQEYITARNDEDKEEVVKRIWRGAFDFRKFYRSNGAWWNCYIYPDIFIGGFSENDYKFHWPVFGGGRGLTFEELDEVALFICDIRAENWGQKRERQNEEMVTFTTKVEEDKKKERKFVGLLSFTHHSGDDFWICKRIDGGGMIGLIRIKSALWEVVNGEEDWRSIFEPVDHAEIIGAEMRWISEFMAWIDERNISGGDDLSPTRSKATSF